MTDPDIYAAVEPFPERFNLCDYYLERNLREAGTSRSR